MVDKLAFGAEMQMNICPVRYRTFFWVGFSHHQQHRSQIPQPVRVSDDVDFTSPPLFD